MKKHVEALRAKEEKAALKAKIAAEKDKAKWRIEETKGEAVYRSMQEALSERGRNA